MNQDHNLLGVIRVLLKWKNQIIIVTVAAGIFAAVYSFFLMDDYYKSTATLYPVNLAYNDRAAIFGGERTDFFGGKEDVNRILTISQSAPISAFIIEKYKLADHYKIDKNKKYWKTKVRKEFEQNYKAIKTDQGAVELSAYDTDPELAANIVRDVIEMTDSVYRFSMQGAKTKQLELITNELIKEQDDADRYNDSLALLGKQFNIVVKAGANSDIVDGNDYKGVLVYKAILAKQKNALGEVNYKTNVKVQLENGLKNDTKSLSVVEAPTASDRKEKPVRSLIVITAMLLTLVVSIFGALLIDQIQDIRRQL